MPDQRLATPPASAPALTPAAVGEGTDWPTPVMLQPAAIALGALLGIALIAVLAGLLLPFDLSQGQAVVILLRLAVPLLILRWPLIGGILAMLLDGADVIIVDLFGPGGMGPFYHAIDKYLDLYYLGLEAFVSLGW